MAVGSRPGGDHDRRRRLEGGQGCDGVLAVAVGPQHVRVLDGVAAAVTTRARSASDVHVGAATERQRAGRQTAQPGRVLEDLAHPTVIEAVAQLDQAFGPVGAGEEAQEPHGGLVWGEDRRRHSRCEVGGPAAGSAAGPRC